MKDHFALAGALAAAALAAALMLPAPEARAEPYLAVRTGLKCANCHVDPSGGGLRTPFGDAYGSTQLPRRMIGGGKAAAWTGAVNDYLRVGGNFRSDARYVDTPDADATSDFAISRATLYGAFTPIPDLLTVYVDEQVAPGGTTARQAMGLLRPGNGRYTVKVGKFFLPFGLRLQDDTAFIRQVTGINFDTPDTGVELGLELPKWSAQAAVTNGTAGGNEIDRGKQTSLSASYVRQRWRLGASLNVNNAALGDRRMGGVFAGLKTGPIAWLAEYDRVTDETAQGDLDMDVSLLEGNWNLAAGQNLKVTYEFFDPPGEDDERERYSLVWELAPFQLLQTRIGIRSYNGIPQIPADNRDEFFAELHIYF
ncbi:MAG TPA: hypothetical protein VFV10_15375 [Gammaproteobacteria bacterium]|nr:hypothetical protein [Gammaproteobacteria bacterium]